MFELKRISQDAFDHNKGQKSAISGRRLHWILIFSSECFPFCPDLLSTLARKSPQNVEKIARFPGGEKSVEPCHVSGCHGFFGPDLGYSTVILHNCFELITQCQINYGGYALSSSRALASYVAAKALESLRLVELGAWHNHSTPLLCASQSLDVWNWPSRSSHIPVWVWLCIRTCQNEHCRVSAQSYEGGASRYLEKIPSVLLEIP